ncbi:hypothetical protein [Sulfurospirillum sp.]|uniref:hypothetical protein n=1 Tax=Sulfurospirillum sp. TaxID=2053622 RepID=UPI002FDD736C
MLKKIFLTPLDPEYIIMFLRSVALLLVIILSYLIFINWEKNLSLIGALGVLISALLASYSVILNINSTVKIKNREISNQVRYVFFHLCLIKMRLVALKNEQVKEKITYMDIERIFDSFEDIFKLLNDIKSLDIISIAHNDMLTSIHMVYLHLSTYQTHVKSIRSSLIKPEPSEYNIAKYQNILKKVDFKLDDVINDLTSILTYLRDSYSKVFQKESKGIESCADYFYNMTKEIK